MRAIACLLLFLSSVVLLLSCSANGGIPMHGTCRNVPSVEECQAAADHYIQNFCLRDCIRHLCVVGRPRCGEDVKLACATSKAHGKEIGGYVPLPEANEPPRSCKQPKEEFNWCELPRSSSCQAQMAVHEFAHDCDWHEGGGQGVPGNDGMLQCE